MFDIAIIGAGPGGYTAAHEAARRGKSVVLFERNLLGGTCLNRGCIPTKALLHSSKAFAEANGGSEYGIICSGVALDFSAMHAHKTKIVTDLREGLAKLMKNDKVTFIEGEAQLTSANDASCTIVCDGMEYEAHELIIATGSVPKRIPIPGIDLPGVLTSDDILEGEGADLSSLIIIGGGVIGVECAELYAALSRQVSILEAMERILPPFDKEIAQRVNMHLKKSKVKIETSARVAEITQQNDTLCVRYCDKKGNEQQLCAHGVLIATGRAAETKGLFAVTICAKLERGALVCDNDGRSSLPHVWAIGDVRAGTAQLAHVAMAQARNVIRAICHEEQLINEQLIPSCVYTSPEVASIGISETEAKERKLSIRVAKVVSGSNAKCLIEGGDSGYLKLIAAKDDGQILGAQLVCPRATDLIGELAVAIAQNMTAAQLASAIHPHPTVSELIAEAAFQLI